MGSSKSKGCIGRETFTLVWLDPECEKDKVFQGRLRQSSSYLFLFTDDQSCEDWLTNCAYDEKIYLIASGQLGKKIVPRIHDLSCIVAIYIYCYKPDNHKPWVIDYSKILHVEADDNRLLEQISLHQSLLDNVEDFHASQILHSSPNPAFLAYELLLEILYSHDYLPAATVAEVMSKLRDENMDDADAHLLLRTFESEYKSTDALKWLSTNTPVARLMNRALRTQNIPMLFDLRFFLADLHQEIRDNYARSERVYRLQWLNNEQIDHLRSSVNQWLVFHGFLRASMRRPIIPAVDRPTGKFQPVLFEIDAESFPGNALFVCPQHLSSVSGREEVLFMCGAVFRVISFNKAADNTLTVKLYLVGEKQIKSLDETKQQLRKDSNLLLVSELFEQADQLDKAKIYYEHLRRASPKDHPLPTFTPSTISKHPTPGKSQFILLGLQPRLSSLAAKMFSALQSLIDEKLTVCNDLSELDLFIPPNTTRLIFTTSESIRSWASKPDPSTKFFILEEDDESKVDHRERFDSSEDLIHQLADELIRRDPSRSKSIHDGLSCVYNEFAPMKDEPPPSPSISIVWLQNKKTTTNSPMDHLEKAYKRIPLLFFRCDEEELCWFHLHTTDSQQTVFLIVDDNYADDAISEFRRLKNVKKIYRCSLTTNTRAKIVFRLTYDLIRHYSDLAEQFEDRKDLRQAKEMCNKAHQLSQCLSELKF